MKKCNICDHVKPFSDFYKLSMSKDGFSYRCKSCDKDQVSKWRAANPKPPAQPKPKNPNRKAENRAKWNAANPEKARESVRKAVKKWMQNNRDKMNVAWSKRRAARLKATPSWADQKLIGEFYFAADFLSMVTGEWYNVDHIVPLQSALVSGLHWEGNLQVLTKAENLKKSNLTWPDMP